jgi:hypothetical protein
MNTDEKMNALKQALTLVFGMLTVLDPTLATAAQYSTLTTAIVTIVPACISIYSVIWSIYSHWGMKKVPENSTALILPASSPAAPPVGGGINLAPLTGIAKVVGVLLFGFLLFGATVPAALAQNDRSDRPTRVAAAPKINPPCLEPIDPRPQCQNGLFAPGQPAAAAGAAAASDNAVAAGNCQFGTFAVLTPANLVQTIQNCGNTFLEDSQAALASATTAKDQPAIACLTPGTALIAAGVGTPGTPGDANASPPVAPTLPKLGGPVLLFQKYREFVLAGGINACQAWVQTVVAATVGGAAGGAGALIGGAALLPK